MRIPESGKIFLVESGILGFGIRNTAQGIRNPTNDWNLEFKLFHWELGFTTWNPESTAWNPECKTVLDFFTWGETLGEVAHPWVERTSKVITLSHTSGCVFFPLQVLVWRVWSGTRCLVTVYLVTQLTLLQEWNLMEKVCTMDRRKTTSLFCSERSI